MVVLNVPILLPGSEGLGPVKAFASLNPLLLAAEGVVVDHPTDPKRCTVYLPAVVLEVTASRQAVLAGVTDLLKRAEGRATLTEGLPGGRA